jgi:ketosteroid isomerase-like protein
MGSTVNFPESVAQAFVRAINRQDADAVAGLMSPAHRFIDSLGSMTEGREKMREGWKAYFRTVPDYAVAVEETYAGGPVVVMLGIAQGTYSRNGQLHAENHWQTPIAIRALIEDGLVAEWRVYADNEPIRRVMAKAKYTTRG